jgi:cbb3-type cytochrome oxidase subunit 1
MKEELLKNLAGIIDYVKQGADFVKEQAPLFIQEYITFKIWLYAFDVVMSVIAFVVGVIVFRKGYKNYIEDDLGIDGTLTMLVGSFLAVVAFITFVCCVEELMKVYFAPRYFLVDSLLSLGK